MKKYATIPNCITLLRMIGTVVMIFMVPLTTWFFVLYTFLGLTDAVDGFIARKTKTTSRFGAKLDSVADLLFYTVMVLRIMPRLIELLAWQIWWFIGLIVAMRVAAYTIAAVREKQFASHHTILNKITGFTVFCVPYVLNLSCGAWLCWIPCAFSFLGTGEELLIQTTSYGKRYKMNTQKSN